MAKQEEPDGTPRFLGICAMGAQSCTAETGSEFGGTWGPCENAVLPQEEICGDEIDQDCDGLDLPCPNSAPVAQDDHADVVAEKTIVIDVLANDSDLDQTPLLVVETDQGINGGTVTIIENGAKIAYVLNTKYFATDSFTYKVSDGKDTSEATVTISLKPDCRFHLNWPHFYWGVMAEYSTIVGAVWNQQQGQGAVCGNASVTSCTAGGYQYEKSKYVGDALDRGRTEICRKKL